MCVFKYGTSVSILSDTVHSLRLKCFSLFVKFSALRPLTRLLTTTTNRQLEKFSRTFQAMLQNYVEDHQNDWYEYASALTYA